MMNQNFSNYLNQDYNGPFGLLRRIFGLAMQQNWQPNPNYVRNPIMDTMSGQGGYNNTVYQNNLYGQQQFMGGPWQSPQAPKLMGGALQSQLLQRLMGGSFHIPDHYTRRSYWDK